MFWSSSSQCHGSAWSVCDYGISWSYSLIFLNLSELYGSLMIKLKKIVGSNNFSAQFIEIISHYKKIGYNINVLQQTACLVVKPITVGNFAFLFNCTRVGLTSDSMTVPTIDERAVAGSCVCCQAHRGLTVGFPLLRYSVVCTYGSLSLFLSAFHTPILKRRSYYGMALSVRTYSRIDTCCLPFRNVFFPNSIWCLFLLKLKATCWVLLALLATFLT